MQSVPESFIPILFKILFGFVALNTLINIVLVITRRKRLYKLLAIYWPTLFLYYLFQGSFNNSSNLAIVLAYSGGYVVSLIMGFIAFEAVGLKFPLKKYIYLLLPFYPVALFLDFMGLGFTWVAMPFSLALSIPIVHGAYYLILGSKKASTGLQRILGVIYLFQVLHNFNYALFRMDPEAQLWGWVVSYVLCDLMAILLPSIALEQASMTEEERLQQQVIEKTQALTQSMKTNDTLLKVMLHDIATPLTAMKWYLLKVKRHPEKANVILEKIEKVQQSIDRIFFQTRDLYQGKGLSMSPDSKVSIDECFKEVAFMFEQPLRDKNISLRFTNEVPPHTYVRANPVTLTHSVISNLVSNSLKFAPPDSEIEISASEKDGNVILEVTDNGDGIPLNVLQRLAQDKSVQSTQGTMGEMGSGFGLSIVKTFVKSFGGEIEFDSAFMHEQNRDYGTKVRITLDRA